MEGLAGIGVLSDALEFTDTDCVPCTAITKVTGSVSVRIGTYGKKIIITKLVDGVGGGIGVLATICTVIVFSSGGQVQNGWLCDIIGIWFVATITATNYMARGVGFGVHTGALAFTVIVCASCRGIIMVIGAASVHTGIFSVVIIITVLTGISGLANTSELDGTSIASVCTRSGLVQNGCSSGATGSVSNVTASTTDCMHRRVGCGDPTSVSECTSTATAPCTTMSKVNGAVSGPTGTCGRRTIITEQPDGTGAQHGASDAICTGCVS